MSSLQVGESPIDSYRTIAAPVEAKLTRKKSRFIALVYPVSSTDEIQKIRDEIQRRYHDARHHCYAYRLVSGAARADDAGEPAGSAGPPILQALEGADLYNVLAVVVRYFGGVKLGIGGLIRAYGDATRAAIAQARVVEQVERARLMVRFPPECTSKVMGLIHRLAAEVDSIDYADEATIVLSLRRSDAPEFTARLADSTGGRGQVKEIE